MALQVILIDHGALHDKKRNGLPTDVRVHPDSHPFPEKLPEKNQRFSAAVATLISSMARY